MKRLNLSEKSEEILLSIPSKYAEVILNSVIAKSLENGVLIEELKIFLNKESISKIKKELDINVTKNIKNREIPETKVKLRKETYKELKKDKEINVFSGFDF
jgi:phage pi2 protein 07